MVLFFECKGSEGVFVVNFCHFYAILLIMKVNAEVCTVSLQKNKVYPGLLP